MYCFDCPNKALGKPEGVLALTKYLNALFILVKTRRWKYFLDCMQTLLLHVSEDKKMVLVQYLFLLFLYEGS